MNNVSLVEVEAQVEARLAALAAREPAAEIERPAPSPELTALLDRRDEIHEDIQRYSRVHAVRAEVERRLAALDAEQAALDEDERAAWAAWAEKVEGPPPSPKIAEREAIARKRHLAVGDLGSARRGAEAVEPKLTALNAQLGEIGEKIFARRLTAVIEEARAANERVLEVELEFVEAAHGFEAIRQALFDLRTRVMSPNDGNLRPVGAAAARMDSLSAAINQLEAMPRPTMLGDPAELARRAEAVRRRIE